MKSVAQDTLRLLEAGGYSNSAGEWVSIVDEQAAAQASTRVWQPGELEALVARPSLLQRAGQIEVTDETTQVAARRLAGLGGALTLLNFASARNPGGGFLSGAKAQEEDLTRCSGLYPCLDDSRVFAPYYGANRASSSLFYGDMCIASERVPFFRTRSRRKHPDFLLDEPFFANVITSPAPNAGQILRRDRKARTKIRETLKRRSGLILALAEALGTERLVLGAWGCGVFRNDPSAVAEAFGEWLESPRFRGSFEQVCFGVYDPSKDRRNYRAFLARFG